MLPPEGLEEGPSCLSSSWGLLLLLGSRLPLPSLCLWLHVAIVPMSLSSPLPIRTPEVGFRACSNPV